MKAHTPVRLALWALLVVILVIYCFPFLYLLSTSFKPPIETIAIPPTIFPRQLSLENYVDLLNDPRVPRALVNSAIIAVLSTVISVVLAVPAAYGVVRSGGRLGGIFIIAVLVTRMVPAVAVGIPLAAMMRGLGLFDSHLGVALAHATVSLPLSIWLMASFFEGVPREMEEAARVDGCSRLTAFVRVVLPVSAGGIAVTTIFAFLASWNEFLFALLLSTLNAQTTPIVIAQFQSQYGLEWGTMTALAAVYSIPVILIAFALQKRIVSGLTLGAVK